VLGGAAASLQTASDGRFFRDVYQVILQNAIDEDFRALLPAIRAHMNNFYTTLRPAKCAS
jgi:hypothetical protein